MKNNVIARNESKRISLKLPTLLCFAMFVVWQMGIVYYSSQTLSINGRLLIQLSNNISTLLIIVGYILAILTFIFLPHKAVKIGRITMGIALVSALALFLPFKSDIISLILYIQVFCCCFMITFESGIIANLFTEKTAIIHLALAYAIANVLVAIIQNDFITIPFIIFKIFMVVACGLQLLFYFKLPSKIWPQYIKKSDKFIYPKSLFRYIYLIVLLTCFLMLFATSVAETVNHGIFVLYISMAIFGLIFYILWKRFNIRITSYVSFLIGLSAIGFVLAILSHYVSSLSLIACIFLGAGGMGLCLQPIIYLLIIKIFPSKYIIPCCLFIAMMTVLVHSILLDLLRNDIIILILIYLLITIVLAVVFLLISPYLNFNFDSGDKIKKDSNWKKNLQAHSKSKLIESELSIAELILRGYKNDEIANETLYTLNTVKTHRKSLYSKLDIHTTKELFDKANN